MYKNYKTGANSKMKDTKRALIVDDEEDIVSVCTMILEDDGFEVQSFTDPIIALSTFKSYFYDIIILDIKMPGMDGFELHKKIKELDNKVKVCFLTASEMYYEIFRSKEYASLDNDLFIHKPIGNKDLLEKVNKIITS
jgi:DNA-binding response OmpR family regulator